MLPAISVCHDQEEGPMGFVRRMGALALGIVGLGGGALAQGPSPLPPGNVTVVVSFPAGGPLDTVARLMSDRMSTRLGRSVVVENRPGAAGNVGAGSVVRAEPNGLTWLMSVDSVWTVNPHLGAPPNFDVDKDLVPIGQVGQVILMLAVNPKVPAKTWTELLAHSKTKPLNFGSAGIGSPGHLALEYLKLVAPFDAAHVPFRGAAPTLQELLAGNIDGAFIVAGVMLDYVREGKIRALAISDTRRMAKFPDVPTAKEAGIGEFVALFSNILAVPAKTPEPVRAYIHAQMKAVMAMPDVLKRLDAIGTEPLATSEKETRAWVAQERERWGKVIKARGVKAAPPPQKK
jgi:tripartite-type tricarboxylate transporter receptor subunit TctC